jgi:hypothetical protein
VSRPFAVLRSATTERLPRFSGTKKRPMPGAARHHVPVTVPARRLHLHDVRSEIGEQDAAQRPGDVLRVLDDAQPSSGRLIASPSPRRAMTTWRISASRPRSSSRPTPGRGRRCAPRAARRDGRPRALEPEQLDALACEPLRERAPASFAIADAELAGSPRSMRSAAARSERRRAPAKLATQPCYAIPRHSRRPVSASRSSSMSTIHA